MMQSMKEQKPLSDIEIAAKIRAGKNFTVKSKKERKRVLDAARFLGSNLFTEKNGVGFDVKFYIPA